MVKKARHAIGFFVQTDADFSLAAFRKSVLQSVGHEFVYDEAARNGFIERERELVQFRPQLDAPLCSDAVRTE